MRLQLRRACAVALVLLAPLGARAEDDWRLTTDSIFYTDTDNVLVVSPQVAVHRAIDQDGGEASARAVVDVISAASVDVVSHATTRFSEVRTEADLALSKAFGDLLPGAGYRFSIEPDYLSHGVRGGLTARLGTPDTVLAASYGLTFDTIGRADTPFETFSETLLTHSGNVGLTQVLGPETIVRGVYTLTVQSGYMEKPYRYVPLFEASSIAAANADGVTLDLDSFDRYRLPTRPPENVPDLRVGHALAVRGLQWIDAIDGSARVDYQLFVDSWGIVAHIVEPEIATHLGEHFIAGVWGRFYIQNGADFWRRTYVVSEAGRIPRYRTLDRELSPYYSLTGGARIEWRDGAWAIYADGSAMYTRWSELLLLDDRIALVAQAGVRWTP